MNQQQSSVDETQQEDATPDGTSGEAAALAPGHERSAPATVSIVIPVHNKASLTRQCLDTILAQSDPSVALEIVVVDDGSTDLTPRLLRGYEGRITVITNSPGKGFAGACNAGAAAATGDYLIFLNNDTIPQPGWVSALVSYSESHAAAGIVGSKLLYPDDTVQHAGVAIGYDRFPRHIYVGFPSNHPAVNKSRPFQAVTAACLLIRRALWEELAGFDTGYRNGWEDVDLCLRARDLGAEVHYCHESVVYHLESVSRDVRAPEERANRERYMARWMDRIVPDDFQYYVADELIQVTYQARYPVHMTVSPRLASWTAEASLRESDRILAERARQVTILLRNNIVLNTRVHEAELRALDAERRAREAYQRLREAGLEVSPPPPVAPGAAPAAATPAPAPVNIIGSIEQPGRLPAPVSEPSLPVSGWANSPFGIHQIEAFVDGDLLTTVAFGLSRPDVAAVHPGFPDGERCGFAGELPLSHLAAGEHTLLLRIHDKRGRFADAAISFELATAGRQPILCACDQPTAGHRTTGRTQLEVAGWALSPAGIERIDCIVDGDPRGSVTTGWERPDVAEIQAGHAGAAQSGFAGSVPLADLAPGDHELLLRVIGGDQAESSLRIPFTIDPGLTGDDTDDQTNA